MADLRRTALIKAVPVKVCRQYKGHTGLRCLDILRVADAHARSVLPAGKTLIVRQAKHMDNAEFFDEPVTWPAAMKMAPHICMNINTV